MTINNLFKISAGRFMHSYANNQFPSHFNQNFKSIKTVHKYPTQLACSKNFFLFRNQSKHLKQRGITKNLGIKGVWSGLKIQTFFFCLQSKFEVKSLLWHWALLSLHAPVKKKKLTYSAFRESSRLSYCHDIGHRAHFKQWSRIYKW